MLEAFYIRFAMSHTSNGTQKTRKHTYTVVLRHRLSFMHKYFQVDARVKLVSTAENIDTARDGLCIGVLNVNDEYDCCKSGQRDAQLFEGNSSRTVPYLEWNERATGICMLSKLAHTIWRSA